MNSIDRPRQRSPRRSYLMFAAALVVVLVSTLTIAWSPPRPQAQQPAAAAGPAATPYVSSDPSLPLPGSFALPTESAVQVEAF